MGKGKGGEGIGEKGKGRTFGAQGPAPSPNPPETQWQALQSPAERKVDGRTKGDEGRGLALWGEGKRKERGRGRIGGGKD